MATPIDERAIDTSDKVPWDDFIDFDGSQGHLKDVQSFSPSNKGNEGPPSPKDLYKATTTHVCEPVYRSRVPIDDLDRLELGLDSDFKSANENPASQQSHLKKHPRILQISEEGFRGSELRASRDTTVRFKNRHRFSESALALLQEFFDDNPYPTEDEKRDLAVKIGSTQKQVTTWFSNKRRRAAPKSKDHVPVSSGPSPLGVIEQRYQSLLQRYFNSPTEGDSASAATIAAAASKNIPVREKKRKPSPTPVNESFDSYSCGVFDDRGYDSVSLSAMTYSSFASSSSQVSHASWAGRQGRKRYNIQNQVSSALKYPRERPQDVTYQCTWCCRGFKHKDAWKRHEESEHCPQHEYVCMLHGYTDTDDGGVTRCVFCGSDDVSEEHLGLHRVMECFQREPAKRSFARPDALLQHIRQKHLAVGQTRPWASAWERPLLSGGRASWECGFCLYEFPSWNLRCKHVAQHFIAGDDMSNWILDLI